MAEFALDYEHLSDVELARLVTQRDPSAVRVITRRNNQRLYRAAWSVLRDRAEAEDAVQDAYLKAFAAIGGFEGRSSLSTWLTRIVINEALEHRRTAEKRQRILREQSVIDIDDYRERLMAGSEVSQSPEAETMRTQIAKLLERAISNLPGGVSASLCAARDRRAERRGDSGSIADSGRHSENAAAALTAYLATGTRS